MADEHTPPSRLQGPPILKSEPRLVTPKERPDAIVPPIWSDKKIASPETAPVPPLPTRPDTDLRGKIIEPNPQAPGIAGGQHAQDDIAKEANKFGDQLFSKKGGLLSPQEAWKQRRLNSYRRAEENAGATGLEHEHTLHSENLDKIMALSTSLELARNYLSNLHQFNHKIENKLKEKGVSQDEYSSDLLKGMIQKNNHALTLLGQTDPNRNIPKTAQQTFGRLAQDLESALSEHGTPKGEKILKSVYDKMNELRMFDMAKFSNSHKLDLPLSLEIINQAGEKRQNAYDRSIRGELYKEYKLPKDLNNPQNPKDLQDANLTSPPNSGLPPKTNVTSNNKGNGGPSIA